jgi:hypothetical protein
MTDLVLHQVGVSFDLYCDARKHKIKIYVIEFKFVWFFYRKLLSISVKPLLCCLTRHKQFFLVVISATHILATSLS